MWARCACRAFAVATIFGLASSATAQQRIGTRIDKIAVSGPGNDLGKTSGEGAVGRRIENRVNNRVSMRLSSRLDYSFNYIEDMMSPFATANQETRKTQHRSRK